MTRFHHLPVRAVVASAALALAFSSPVGAEDYSSQSAAIVSDPSPSAGQTITVSGTTTPNTAVTVTLSQAVANANGLATAAASTMTLGTTTSNSAGAYSLSVTVPTTLSSGNYVMAVSAAGSVISSTTLAIAAGAGATPAAPAAPAAPSQGSLPVTGNDAAPFAAFALVAITAGGALVTFSRRLA